jgi:hypothetical protein
LNDENTAGTVTRLTAPAATARRKTRHIVAHGASRFNQKNEKRGRGAGRQATGAAEIAWGNAYPALLRQVKQTLGDELKAARAALLAALDADLIGRLADATAEAMLVEHRDTIGMFMRP